ncbi:MAG: beta-carotene ketolase [Leptolyngbyaceae cyanobacterium CRU_2_3]|nr:beta-carotene ketolase [Leptolyngbyaceae cyanobacterium CRU_2_3]
MLKGLFRALRSTESIRLRSKLKDIILAIRHHADTIRITLKQLPCGLIIACLIILTWAISLSSLLRLDLSQLNIFYLFCAVLWQVFLYVGLFVSAHDAIHGTVYPNNLRLNDWVGSLLLIAYGLFSYKQLSKTHGQHHQNPASELDPDFHDGHHANFFAWYFDFMRRYWSWARFLGLVVVFHTLHRLLQIPESNLVLFWIVPSILSSVQLFYFGTFLPHREPEGGYKNIFRSESIYRPFFWSLITCYHFGYHREHHQYPHIPWWQLPSTLKGTDQGTDFGRY